MMAINKACAVKFEANKRAEDLSKRLTAAIYSMPRWKPCPLNGSVRDKYGDAALEASESSSSDEEDEDEEAEFYPSYEEGDSDESGESEGEGEGEVGVSEDEDALERQDESEREYNFRYEEPGGDQITTYPRMVAGSVRREHERRRERRKVREKRREREREQKQEELKRLKKLKRKEIKQKLERIKRITGNPNVGFIAADLEEDFDPSSYDQAMARAFDEDYYELEIEEGWGEGEEEEEEWTPVFFEDASSSLEDEYGDWDLDLDLWEPDREDPDFDILCLY